MALTMNTSGIPNSSYQFIELNRTFRELTIAAGASDDVDVEAALRGSGRLHWPDLVAARRAIILAEAGAGKTRETLNIARRLRAEGKQAFFLRLEHISSYFEEAFEVGESSSFEAWLSSSDDGFIFLDSVDEARLKGPSDVEIAIRKLGKKIAVASNRAHVIITSRISAWRPRTDLLLCAEHLPHTPNATREVGVDRDGSNESIRTEDAPSETRPPFIVVALDNLSADQVATFVESKGVDSRAFQDAVERADAWSFTARPQDLEELTQFWIDEGRMGSRLELMQGSIARRLKERDQSRAEQRPLSEERARQGARLLAAAATLTQMQVFAVPDGSDRSKGIDVAKVLEGWNERDQLILLSRPIFDEAIYGTVRFHHRSVREYLAAEWFADMLGRETSRRSIEDLLFRNQYGLDVVVPALRSVLPWLILFDEKVRERVRKIAPEITFEGGDPSSLPIEVRRHVLDEVCEQMAVGAASASVRNYDAVQRFANADIAEKVCSLLGKYEADDELTTFLLRMVWLGEIGDALPYAKKAASDPERDRYTRIVAVRALRAIGTEHDMAEIRCCFSEQESALDRELLAELLVDLRLAETTLPWLLLCFSKAAPRDRFSVDGLADRLGELVERAEISSLPTLVAKLSGLLSETPYIDERHCPISKKHSWLMPPTCKALERLIKSRQSSATDLESLSVIRKLSVFRDFSQDDIHEIKADLSGIVSEWDELNRALFWYEVERSREDVLRQDGSRLTELWRVSPFEKYWRFEAADFDYAVEQVKARPMMDDRLVALSLAFDIYRSSGRPRKWREAMRRAVADDVELSNRLDRYLSPPARGEEWVRIRRQQAYWKRRAKSRQEKSAIQEAASKKYLQENLHKESERLQREPGVVTGAIHYLHDRTRNERSVAGRWTSYSWKSLIDKYGSDIAKFYRDGVVAFWRHHNPTLRSEGAPFNQTTLGVIVGLTGIEIEAIETPNWASSLGELEVELACKYASFELNGFPTWFPGLFEAHPHIISRFLLVEIKYELAVSDEATDVHYLLDDVSSSGQWAWDTLAPQLCAVLEAHEPTNLAQLEKILKVVHGSRLSKEAIEALASRKCVVISDLDHAARWFASWVGVAPDDAIPALCEKLDKIGDDEARITFAMAFLTSLVGGFRVGMTSSRSSFKTPPHLKSLYLLMHRYIRREDDIQRAGKGAYSPGLRDHAQDARNMLFNLLNQIPGKESYLAITDLASMDPDPSHRPWMMHHARAKAEAEADLVPWTLQQVRDFAAKFERTPASHRELFDLAVLRLLDLKDDLENGDSSMAKILRSVEQETDMRNYIGRELREKAFGRYTIPQEEELADAKRPDLRFHGNGFDGPVPMELKLADRWSGPGLFERIENQLCGDYLRDSRSNRGLFVLVYSGEKMGWDVPGASNRLNFDGLVSSLQQYWTRISHRFPSVDDVRVIGIDLTKRSN